MHTRGRTQAGFTMIELLVVMGILVLTSGFALMVSMETFRGSSFRSDRSLLVALLLHARAQAMSNVCTGSTCTDGMPHGVHIESDKFVVFQGATYNASDSANAEFDANPAFTHTGLTDIVFSQLSATTSDTGDIVLTGQGHTSTITIGSHGQILWTN